MRTTRSTVHFPDGSVLCLFSVVVTYEWGLVRMQLKEIRKQGKGHGASSSLRERERESGRCYDSKAAHGFAPQLLWLVLLPSC